MRGAIIAACALVTVACAVYVVVAARAPIAVEPAAARAPTNLVPYHDPPPPPAPPPTAHAPAPAPAPIAPPPSPPGDVELLQVALDRLRAGDEAGAESAAQACLSADASNERCRDVVVSYHRDAADRAHAAGQRDDECIHYKAGCDAGSKPACRNFRGLCAYRDVEGR